MKSYKTMHLLMLIVSCLALLCASNIDIVNAENEVADEPSLINPAYYQFAHSHGTEEELHDMDWNIHFRLHEAGLAHTHMDAVFGSSQPAAHASSEQSSSNSVTVNQELDEHLLEHNVQKVNSHRPMPVKDKNIDLHEHNVENVNSHRPMPVIEKNIDLHESFPMKKPSHTHVNSHASMISNKPVVSVEIHEHEHTSKGQQPEVINEDYYQLGSKQANMLKFNGLEQHSHSLHPTINHGSQHEYQSEVQVGSVKNQLSSESYHNGKEVQSTKASYNPVYQDMSTKESQGGMAKYGMESTHDKSYHHGTGENNKMHHDYPTKASYNGQAGNYDNSAVSYGQDLDDSNQYHVEGSNDNSDVSNGQFLVDLNQYNVEGSNGNSAVSHGHVLEDINQYKIDQRYEDEYSRPDLKKDTKSSHFQDYTQPQIVAGGISYVPVEHTTKIPQQGFRSLNSASSYQYSIDQSSRRGHSSLNQGSLNTQSSYYHDMDFDSI